MVLSRPVSEDRGRRSIARRAGALVAATAVVLSGLVPAVAATAAPLPEPLAFFDFSATSGTTVPDASGHGHDATIVGTGSSIDGDALSLPGGGSGSSAAYVELPKGLFDGRSTITVSAWLQDRTGAGNQAAMFFGTTENLPQQYWLLNPANPAGQVKSVVTDGPRSGQPWTLERGISPTDGTRGIPGPAATSEWALYTTVITPTSITAYLGDTKIGTVSTSRTVTDFGSDLVGYIGRSSYPDRFWAGGVRDVAIFDSALGDDDVKALVAQGTPTNEQDVATAAKALSIPDADDVRGNVTLPTTGSNGTTVSWTSSNAQVVTPTGEVTRPATGSAAAKVTVTATISKGSSDTTRSFELVVQPKPEAQKLEGYFFPFFTGESTTTDEEISFATSRGDDPKNWLTLHDGKPVLSSDQGEQGIRDPFVMRSADGDRFYMLSTDLNMFDRYNGDFGRAQEVGSRKLNVWQSDDLATWSPLRQITVSSELAGNTWAPEATWDPDRGEYVVYWASNLYPSASTAGRKASDTHNRMMMVTTRDFVTFSEPKPWVDVKRGAGKGTIDATVVRDGDTYYRFIKDEASMTVRQERSTDLTATVTGSLPTTTSAPGWQLVKEQIGVGQPNPWGGTFTNGEGPTVFEDNAEAGHWYMLIDQPSYHGGQGYMMFETRDIASGTWTSVRDATLPARPRHGTVLPITAAEQQRLLAAYPTDETADYSITADPSKNGAEIDDAMYGVFFEDINNAADGGLYAELVRNRSFEFLPVDNRGFTGMTAWTPVAVGGGSGSATPVNDDKRMNERNRTYLQLDLTSGATGTYGVENAGFDTGVALTKDAAYDVSFWARTTAAGGTPVSLVLRSADGSALSNPFTATVGGDGWLKYRGSVTATATTDAARVLVQAAGAGTVRLDEVSVFPKDTFMGRENGLRKDIAQKIADLHPKFVRFPGGCIVNVNSHEDYSADSNYERARSYQWKDSVGPVETRATNANFWGYNQSLGLGYYEYFQFAEDIGAKPVPDVPALMNGCGQALQPTDPALLQRHIQDTLDLIEFAKGDVTTTWGKLRADMGHPAPFALDRIEIGNEENYPEAFMANFTKFRDAIAAAYPDMILISNSGPDAEGANFEKHWEQNTAEKVDMVDEHYYRDPSWFLSHNQRYDSYDRNGPKVWIGEYASRDNLFANALSEAAYMTGLERNADVVKMASYAPLLADTSNVQWRPDLIWFDRDQVWGSANYEVQKLFMRNVGDRVVPTTAAGDLASTTVSGAVGLSTWSTSARYDDVKVTTPDGKTLFADDFSDKNDDGWTKLAGAGSWSAADGSYVQSSTTANNTLVAGPALTATDYDVSLKATKLAGAEGFLVGFGVQGSADYFWWNLGGFGNTRSLVEKAVGGAKSTVAETGTPRIETGRTYDLRVQVRGSQVTLFADGVQQGQFTNTAVEPFAQVMTKDEASGDVILKVVNAQAQAAVTKVDLGGLTVLPTADVTMLSAAPSALNTATSTPVAPKSSQMAVSSSFTHSFEPYSVTFVRMHTRTDATPPTVTVQTAPAQPDGADGWYVSQPSITATATDDVDAAPRLEVSTDGEKTWSVSTGAVTPAEGAWTYAFRAIDAAGNVSASVTAAVKIDRTAPVTTTATDATARTVTLTASDSGSGVARVEYRVGDAATWTTAPGAQAVVAVGSGATTVSYRAVDVAGNVSGTGSTSVGATATDPTLAVSGDLVAGGVITVSGTGWPANADGELELHSTPVKLGTVRTDAAGAFLVNLTIPADTPAGAHRVIARIGGVEAAVDIEVKAATGGSTPVVPPAPAASNGSTPSPLAVTGGVVSGAALAFGLIALLIGATLKRRRRAIG
ncbi:alpha-L-arabinofuranosidase C-terminal domain-containing protein [Microbacterium testaceum]|uniref:alpha-L-arabinofuranosidase C-terminal domain-containing protein n=1 Tax=Microbacterium testaceum TaxID=2033 RepID=UPI0012455B3F|nr:alpha-L-arabinofuranosidase C-terminal domain-containing protein [Microbacterium testaceum]